jgi:hypothetical protein
MNANIYRPKVSLFAYENPLRSALCAEKSIRARNLLFADKGIYRGDLQSLYCVFISFDLVLCVWKEFNSFSAPLRSLS